jgi:hypothetical protein
LIALLWACLSFFGNTRGGPDKHYELAGPEGQTDFSAQPEISDHMTAKIVKIPNLHQSVAPLRAINFGERLQDAL